MQNERPVLKIIGTDGNAFALLGKARRAAYAAGMKDKWPEIQAEATAGDYDHLLGTLMEYFDVE